MKGRPDTQCLKTRMTSITRRRDVSHPEGVGAGRKSVERLQETQLETRNYNLENSRPPKPPLKNERKNARKRKKNSKYTRLPLSGKEPTIEKNEDPSEIDVLTLFSRESSKLSDKRWRQRTKQHPSASRSPERSTLAIMK